MPDAISKGMSSQGTPSASYPVWWAIISEAPMIRGLNPIPNIDPSAT